MLPWLLCGVLFLILTALCIKLYLLQKSMDEICLGIEECLTGDTNILLSISSHDRHAKKLAASLNRQLRLLRRQRQQYLSGDQELKEAVTNISHDLRTPLTAVCGYLDLLEREETSAEVSRYLSFIRSRANAMTALTEELFRYSIVMSASDPLHTEEIHINRILEESIAGFYAALTEAGITPAIHISEHPCIRQLNKASLSRIFNNLLNNAIKYSGGDLEITLTESGEIIFSNTAPNLDEVQIGKLFHRFFTVEAARNSTGLGLAIAKKLTEEMGGSISSAYADGRLSIIIRFPNHEIG